MDPEDQTTENLSEYTLETLAMDRARIKVVLLLCWEYQDSLEDDVSDVQLELLLRHQRSPDRGNRINTYNAVRWCMIDILRRRVRRGEQDFVVISQDYASMSPSPHSILESLENTEETEAEARARWALETLDEQSARVCESHVMIGISPYGGTGPKPFGRGFRLDYYSYA